jgi:hypothetical protein
MGKPPVLFPDEPIYKDSSPAAAPMVKEKEPFGMSPTRFENLKLSLVLTRVG